MANEDQTTFKQSFSLCLTNIYISIYIYIYIYIYVYIYMYVYMWILYICIYYVYKWNKLKCKNSFLTFHVQIRSGSQGS